LIACVAQRAQIDLLAEGNRAERCPAPPLRFCHGNSIRHASKVKASHAFMLPRRHLAILQ